MDSISGGVSYGSFHGAAWRTCLGKSDAKNSSDIVTAFDKHEYWLCGCDVAFLTQLFPVT